MRKPEVQTLVALICRSLQISFLVLSRHTVPNRVPPLIDCHIEYLRADEQRKIVRADSNQHLVAPAIQRLVIFAVDVLRDDT